MEIKTTANEDWPACTKEAPLYLTLRGLGYLFSIARLADQLLNEILDNKPIAECARELAADLRDLDGNTVGGCGIESDVYNKYSEALLEVEFTNVELHTDQRKITLWQET